MCTKQKLVIATVIEQIIYRTNSMYIYISFILHIFGKYS